MNSRYILGIILITGLLYCSSTQETEEEETPTKETQATESQVPPTMEPGDIRTGTQVEQEAGKTQEQKKDPNQVFGEMEKVYFSQGSTSLSLKNMFTLDEYVKYLKENPSVNIKVNGYTDYTSNPEINQIISQMRAESVRNYLIQNGVAPKRILSKGMGVYNPHNPPRDREGMKKSRTVEFVAR
ncbi:MAG: OmpA family protein [Leptospiraceae bacterium]|nr:OmpA family protein [Leptospiraceae bacterium]MCP5493958.1 OmpA family protein [Leptospiraceae bacterium]